MTKKILSNEELSRALSELCGPGLRGGANGERCLLQAAFNTDNCFPPEEQPTNRIDRLRALLQAFDLATDAKVGWKKYKGSPEDLIDLVLFCEKENP